MVKTIAREEIIIYTRSILYSLTLNKTDEEERVVLKEEASNQESNKYSPAGSRTGDGCTPRAKL